MLVMMSCQHDYSGCDPAIAQLADLFHLLGDPTRLRIVLACMAGADRRQRYRLFA
jgi:hypothetical protein